MDPAYDAVAIAAQSVALGHVPLIDRNFRAQHEARSRHGQPRRQRLHEWARGFVAVNPGKRR
jgi:hypothetical protein